MKKFASQMWWIIKILTIVLALWFVHHQYGNSLRDIFAQDQLSLLDKASRSVQVIFDIPMTEDSIDQESFDVSQISTPSIPQVAPTQEDEKQQYASKVIDTFNRHQDPIALTESFIRSNRSQYSDIQVGHEIVSGAIERVKELADGYYFSELTRDGQDFRSHYLNLPDYQYRIGEQLFELYLIADDVRLEAWQQPDILAAFLSDSFGNEIQGQDYSHELLAVRLGPTPFSVKGVPYVRLVAVRTFYR